MLTDRQAREGDSHNLVIGPDLQWRHDGRDTVTAQLLVSDTRTPVRPDLAAEWTGQTLDGTCRASVQWAHSTTHFDLTGIYKDIGNGFRADTGFVPQVGYRDTYVESGYTVHPSGFLSRVRTWFYADRQIDLTGATILRQVRPSIGMDARGNSFMQFQVLERRSPQRRPDVPAPAVSVHAPTRARRASCRSWPWTAGSGRRSTSRTRGSDTARRST